MRSFPSISTLEMIQTSSQFAQDMVHQICAMNDEPQPSSTIKSLPPMSPDVNASIELDKTRHDYGRFIYYAKLHVQNNELPEALAEVNNAAKLYNNISILRVLRSALYVLLGRLDRAVADAEAVWSSDAPALDRCFAYCIHAQCDILAGQMQAAMRRLSGALKLRPHHYLACLARANVQLYLNLTDKALVDFSRVEKETSQQLTTRKVFSMVATIFVPNAHGGNVTAFLHSLRCLALDGLGRVSHNLGAFRKALTYYRKALEVDSRVADIRRHMGETFEALDDDDEAFTAYTKSAELSATFNPQGVCDDPVVLRLRASLLMRRRDWAGAEEDLRGLLALKCSRFPEAVTDLGECALHQGKVQAALGILGSASDTRAHAQVQLAQAVRHMQVGRLGRAETIVDSLLSRPDAPAMAYLCRSYLAMRSNNLTAAIRSITQAGKLDPGLAGQPHVQFNNAMAAGLQAMDEGKNAKAYNIFAKASNIMPNEPQPHVYKALAVVFGDQDLVPDTMEGALVEVDAAIAKCEVEIDRARMDWDRYTDAGPDPTKQLHTMHFIKGFLLASLGRGKEAAASIQSAATTSQGKVTDYLVAAALADLIGRDDLDSAIESLTEIITQLEPAKKSQSSTRAASRTPVAEALTPRALAQRADTSLSHIADLNADLQAMMLAYDRPESRTYSELAPSVTPDSSHTPLDISEPPTDRLYSDTEMTESVSCTPSYSTMTPPPFAQTVRGLASLEPDKEALSLVLSMRGRLHHTAGRLSTAIADLTRAVRHAPEGREKAVRLCEKADVEWWCGKLTDALASYQEAIKEYPRSVRAYVCVARIQLELGKWTAACSSMNTVVQQHPAARAFLFDRDVAGLIASLFDCPLDFAGPVDPKNTNRFVLQVLRKLNSLLASETAKDTHVKTVQTGQLVDPTLSYPWHFVGAESNVLSRAQRIQDTPHRPREGSTPQPSPRRTSVPAVGSVLPSPAIHSSGAYAGIFSPTHTTTKAAVKAAADGRVTHLAFVHAVRGVVQHCIGNAQSALEDYDRAIALAASADGISAPSQQLILNKMVAYLQLEQYNHALDLLVSSPAFANNTSALLLKGLMLTHLEDDSAAQETFRELCLIDNSFAESYLADSVRYVEILPPSLPQIIDMPVRVRIADRDVFIRLAMPSFRATPPPTMRVRSCFDPRWLTRSLLPVQPKLPISQS
ncbi:TPR repeat [Carpediemonas membranifera]|uniref:TPR repeat n=1 Tax=Carpediemonas membranifera TaxID=201153 RepID=A0A8J6E143_9EUKA|nr:TPR repeat [Carpediemonas membranifera]|eukprot:KAG9392621.1 TPR repeat [Carpediemonas membranifera]